MRFAELAKAFDTLESESSRLEMVRGVQRLLPKLPPAIVSQAVWMMQGRLAPEFVGLELGVAEKLTVKAIARTYGQDEPKIVSLQQQLGDLGLAAESLAGRRSQRALGARELTVENVYGTLEKVARAAGTGSQDQKIGGVAELLHAATPLEARFVVRLVTGKLRLGVAEQTVVDALANVLAGLEGESVTQLDEAQRAAREEAKATCQRALDVTSDLGLVAKTALEAGLGGLRRLRLRLGVPLRPMLSEREDSIEAALARMPGAALVEYKYDGLRMQAHVGPTVEIFSRRLERLTEQFPDVRAALADAFGNTKVIVEGEAVAVDPKTGRMRPFQELSQRRGRKHGLGGAAAGRLDGLEAPKDMTKEIPVRLFLFDVLWAEGEDLTQVPLRTRRERLAKLLRPSEAIVLAHQSEMRTGKAIEEYFQSVTEMGAEGIMIKNPESAYQAGSRGYSWIKFKADYDASLADTFDLVAIGAYWGQGRRGGWYGALLLAARNEDTGRYESLCRLATGFDDATLQGLESRFRRHVVSAKPKDVDSELEPDVWLAPHVVLEVQGAELTLSPNHRCAWGAVKPESGLSVRFPRFTGRWREDKSAAQATTSAEVVRLFQARRKKLARA